MTISNSLVLADGAFGTIGTGLSVSDTALTFTTGHGARFPAVAAGQVLYCIILNSTNVLEEVAVTAHTNGSDSATIVRAAGGTTAKTWSVGDRIEARVSSTVLKRLQLELPETILSTADAGATFTGSMSPPALGYISGVIYHLSCGTSNSGAAPTIALDGLAAVPVALNGGTTVVANQMPTQGLYHYDGTNFILLNPGYGTRAASLFLGVGSSSGTPSFRALPTPTTPSVTTIASGSGTYTTPAGATRLKILLVGGGGGGGAAGTGGNGGNTTFGGYTAGGGTGGGAAQGGGIASEGGNGGSPTVPANDASHVLVYSLTGSGGNPQGNSANGGGGSGGASCLGGSGRGGGCGSSGQAAAANTGSGGGGAGTAAGFAAGSGGGSGACVAVLFLPTLAATISYSVGSGGSGSSAATGGGTSGAGGVGIIVVEEFYD